MTVDKNTLNRPYLQNYDISDQCMLDAVWSGFDIKYGINSLVVYDDAFCFMLTPDCCCGAAMT